MNTKEDYIKYKLQKAEESIAAARVLIENDFYGNAISTIYYAAFHAVNALLINNELNPKTHSGVKSLFHKEFVFSGKVSRDFAEI